MLTITKIHSTLLSCHLCFTPHSCLENPMGGGAWWASVHGVAEGQTRLSNSTFTFHFHALEKEMATHSHVLALRIPGTGEPGGLPSMGSLRVGHDWNNLAAAAGTQKGIREDTVSFHVSNFNSKELFSLSWQTDFQASVGRMCHMSNPSQSLARGVGS